jgi:TrmH family RNA methyltransferase
MPKKQVRSAGRVASAPPVASRDARFQQWQSLLGNRARRMRAGEFLVQGVRPISLAAEHGWRFRALLHAAGRPLSGWAQDLLRRVDTVRVPMAPSLLAELGEKADGAPELVAVVEMPADDLGRIAAGGGFLGVVLDRPGSPGNIGSVIRSADAFGAAGVIVTGHAADVYDPKAVRASTGSLFALPVVRRPSHREVAVWVAAQRARGRPVVIVGTDERAHVDASAFDFTQPALLIVGNETAGLGSGWRGLCDVLVRIPMTGADTSLNMASAATVVLYEAARQRGLPPASG